MPQTAGGGRHGVAGRGPADWPLLATIAAGTSVLAAAHLVRRPDLTFTADFLFHDHGNQLLIGRQLAAGASLYADLAYPYGALPAYLLALIAGVSLTAVTYVATLSALSVAFVLMIAHAVRRTTTRGVAALVVVAGVMPFAVTPGGVAGAYTNNSYIGLERLALAGLVLLWRPPWDRSVGRSAGAGALAGALQFVKFGSGVLATAAWLLVDLAASLRAGRPPVSRRRVLTAGTAFAGASLAVESVRWIALFATYSADMAWDVAWPAYTAAFYQTIPARWPDGVTAAEFGTQYLTPLAALAATLAALAWWWRRPEGAPVAEAGLLLPSAFFVIGTAGYFGHIHTVRQYAWALIPAAALWLAPPVPWRRVIAAGLAAPAVALMLRTALLSSPAPDMRPLRMGNGDVLWLHGQQVDAVTRIGTSFERAVAGASPGSVLVVPIAGGLHFYFGGEPTTRHLWLLPHYIRPYDRPTLEARLPAVKEVFVVAGEEGGGSAGAHWTSALQDAFGEPAARDLQRRAVRVETIAPRWWHIRLDAAPPD